MSIKDGHEPQAARGVPIILVRGFRYVMTGGLAAMVTLLVAVVLTDHFRVEYLISQAIGFFSGVLVNYPLSRVWAFENSCPHVLTQFSSFVLVSLVGLGVNEGTLALSVAVFHVWKPFGMVLGIGVAFLWNFLGNNFFTFGTLR